MIKAAYNKYGSELVLFHFDAHTDLRKNTWGGHVPCHGNQKVHGLYGGDSIYQFGIRSGLGEEFRLGRERTNFYPFEVTVPLEMAVKKIGDRPLYVTLDIDVVDPAYAPGTGTPEPGGCTSMEILQAAHLFGGCNLIGMDIVEVMGYGDPAGITGVLAAKILREVLIAVSKGKRR